MVIGVSHRYAFPPLSEAIHMRQIALISLTDGSQKPEIQGARLLRLDYLAAAQHSSTNPAGPTLSLFFNLNFLSFSERAPYYTIQKKTAVGNEQAVSVFVFASRAFLHIIPPNLYVHVLCVPILAQDRRCPQIFSFSFLFLFF